MTIETHVTSKELAERLNKAGYSKKTEFSWVADEIWDKTMQSDYETPSTPNRSTWISAPLATELLEQLPLEAGDRNTQLTIVKMVPEDGWMVDYGDFSPVQYINKSLPDALASMYLYLVENKYIINE